MKKAYITMCNSEKYVRGALTLYESLNATKTTIPLIVFIPKKTPQSVRHIFKEYAQLCTENVCKLQILETEDNVEIPSGKANKNSLLRWDGTFDKLLVFGLASYDKLVFIDSDMLVFNNIDHLFEKAHLSACFDGHYDKRNLNSGLMVIEPTNDKQELARIMNCIGEVLEEKDSFGDQDVIRKAYPEWRTNDNLHLSAQYNTFFENVAQYKNKWNYDLACDVENPIYIVHFIGWDKPWFRGKKIKWWYYNFVWRRKMCKQGRKLYHNNIVSRVFKEYDYFFKQANKKLKKLKIKIFEMV